MPNSSFQRITSLTPLSAVLAVVATRIGAVQPRKSPVAAARGRVLAEDVVASERPPCPIALRDGFAVDAATIAGAGPYTPVPFASMPRRVDAGEPLPSGTDAVVPLDAVTQRGDRAEAIAAVAAGEGVLPAGGDVSPRTPLRRAGERLRVLDIAIATAAGIAEVTVREPRIRIACGSAAMTPSIDAALVMLARAVTGAGGIVLGARGEAGHLDEALTDDRADAVIAIGGTGSGRHDVSVQTLARLGRVEAHGIAVSPGESAAFGLVGERPVLLMPGRLDAALAIWLLIGRHLIARFAGGSVDDAPVMLAAQAAKSPRRSACRTDSGELLPTAWRSRSRPAICH